MCFSRGRTGNLSGKVRAGLACWCGHSLPAGFAGSVSGMAFEFRIAAQCVSRVEGLATYLERFAQDWLAGVGIRCRLDLPVQFPEWHLSSELRHNVFLAFKDWQPIWKGSRRTGLLVWAFAAGWICRFSFRNGI